jgi:outer membrane autotransporter protein
VTSTATDTPTPTVTSAYTDTPTPIPTKKATATPTPTPTSTDTPTNAPTAGPGNTDTPTPTATNTSTPTPTSIYTNTPTPTPSKKPTLTPSPTKTPTPPALGAPGIAVTSTPLPVPTLPHNSYTKDVANSVAIIDANGSADGELQKVLNAISLLTPGEIPGALEQLVPSLAGAGIDIVPRISEAMTGAIDDLSGIGGSSSGDNTPTDKIAWMKPFAMNVNQDSDGGVPGYNADVSGLVLGMDDQISSDTRAGWNIGYARTDMNGIDGADNQSLDIDTYQLGLYARKELEGDVYTTGKAQFGWNNNDSTRDIIIGGINLGRGEGSYDSWYTLLNVTVGKQYDISEDVMLSPEFSINYVYIDQDGYTEHGSSANLKVDDANEDSLIFSVGGKLNFRVEETKSITAHLDIGYEALSGTTDLTSTFVGGSGPAFTTDGADNGRMILTTGLGLNLMEGERLNMSINYDATMRDQYTDQGVSATVRYKW